MGGKSKSKGTKKEDKKETASSSPSKVSKKSSKAKDSPSKSSVASPPPEEVPVVSSEDKKSKKKSSKSSSSRQKNSAVTKDSKSVVDEPNDIVLPTESSQSILPIEETSIEDKSIPIDETSVPIEETSVPIEENSVPIEENSVPIEETSIEEAPVPVEETSVPVEETSIEEPSIEEAPVPVEETSVPVEEAPVSVDEPSIEEPSIEETPVAVEETSVPVEEPSIEEPSIEDAPDAVEESSVPEEEPSVPVEESSVPVEEPSVPEEEPSVPEEEPSVPVEEPSVPEEEPSVSDESNQSQKVQEISKSEAIETMAKKTQSKPKEQEEEEKVKEAKRQARSQELQGLARAQVQRQEEIAKATATQQRQQAEEAQAQQQAQAQAAKEAQHAENYEASTPTEAYRLGQRLYDGVEVARDVPAALQLLSQAASGGVAGAHLLLGRAAWAGVQSEPSVAQAMHHYTRAAALATPQSAVHRELKASLARGDHIFQQLPASAHDPPTTLLTRWYAAAPGASAYTAGLLSVPRALHGEAPRFEWPLCELLSAPHDGAVPLYFVCPSTQTSTQGSPDLHNDVLREPPSENSAVLLGYVWTSRQPNTVPLMRRRHALSSDPLLYVHDERFLASETRLVAGHYGAPAEVLGYVYAARLAPVDPAASALPVDPASSWVDGPGVHVANPPTLLEGKDTWFAIHFHDELGHPMDSLLKQIPWRSLLKVDIVGPKGTPVDVRWMDDEEERKGAEMDSNQVTVHYVPNQGAGDYHVAVTWEGRPLKDCPKTVPVRAAPSALHSRVLCPSHGKEGRALPIALHIADANGRPLSSAEDVASLVSLSVLRPEPSRPLPPPVPSSDDEPGAYATTYTPTVPGRHEGDALCEGVPVLDSPWAVDVRPAPHALHSYAEGPGLLSAQVARAVQLTVHAVDVRGTPLSLGGDSEDFSIHIRPDHSELYLNDTEESTPNAVHVSSWKDSNDGTYHCTYEPKEAGNHVVSIACNGQPIKDMPWVVYVKPAPEASQSYAHGPGLQAAWDNEPAFFTVVLVDQDGVQRTDGGDAVTVRVTAQPDGLAVPVSVEDRDDGTYAVRYEPDAPGNVSIEVLVDGRPVRDAPFSVVVREGTDVDRCAVGEFSFTIQARDKRGNAKTFGGDLFAVSVQAKNNQPIEPPPVVSTVDREDGSYSARYSLPDSGSYLLHVSLNSKPIHSSPLKQRV